MWMGKKRYLYSSRCLAFGGIDGESNTYGFGNVISGTFNGCTRSSVDINTSFDTL